MVDSDGVLTAKPIDRSKIDWGKLAKAVETAKAKRRAEARQAPEPGKEWESGLIWLDVTVDDICMDASPEAPGAIDCTRKELQ